MWNERVRVDVERMMEGERERGQRRRVIGRQRAKKTVGGQSRREYGEKRRTERKHTLITVLHHQTNTRTFR